MSQPVLWNHLELFNATSHISNFILVVLNQPIRAKPSTISSLWKRATVRITVDGGTNHWREFSAQYDGNGSLPLPDYATGDFDSITAETKAFYEGKGVKLVPTPDQDETDFTKAVRQAKKVIDEDRLNVKYVVALCETSGRLDQIMANLETLYHAQKILKDSVALVNLASDSATWLLQPGDHAISVTEDYPLSKYWCGLIPLSGPTSVTTTGLKWNLTNGTLAFGELVSTSNTFSSSSVTVRTNKPLIWTMELR